MIILLGEARKKVNKEHYEPPKKDIDELVSVVPMPLTPGSDRSLNLLKNINRAPLEVFETQVQIIA